MIALSQVSLGPDVEDYLRRTRENTRPPSTNMTTLTTPLLDGDTYYYYATSYHGGTNPHREQIVGDIRKGMEVHEDISNGYADLPPIPLERIRSRETRNHSYGGWFHGIGNQNDHYWNMITDFCLTKEEHDNLRLYEQQQIGARRSAVFQMLGRDRRACILNDVFFLQNLRRFGIEGYEEVEDFNEEAPRLRRRRDRLREYWPTTTFAFDMKYIVNMFDVDDDQLEFVPNLATQRTKPLRLQITEPIEKITSCVCDVWDWLNDLPTRIMEYAMSFLVGPNITQCQTFSRLFVFMLVFFTGFFALIEQANLWAQIYFFSHLSENALANTTRLFRVNNNTIINNLSNNINNYTNSTVAIVNALTTLVNNTLFNAFITNSTHTSNIISRLSNSLVRRIILL